MNGELPLRFLWTIRLSDLIREAVPPDVLLKGNWVQVASHEHHERLSPGHTCPSENPLQISFWPLQLHMKLWSEAFNYPAVMDP